MKSAIEILAEIQERYGLTDVKLVHYKSKSLQEYDGEVDITLLSRQELSGNPIAVDFLQSDKILMVYEQQSLGVFIVVHKKKETKN